MNSSRIKTGEERPIVIIEVDKPQEAQKLINAGMSFVPGKLVENGLEVVADREIIAQVVSLLVRGQIKVYEIKRVTKSLEDIFMETTGRE